MENYFSQGHLSDLGVAAAVEQLRAERPDRLPPAVQAHLDECRACRTEVAELYTIVQQTPDPPPAPATAYRWRWAGLTGLILALAIFSLWPDTPPAVIPPEIPVSESVPTDTVLVPADTLVPVSPTEPSSAQPIPSSPPTESAPPVYAQHFVPDEMLEPLVGQNVRATASGTFTPGIDTRFAPGSRIAFSWPNVPEGPYTLLVLDNTGERIDTLTTEATAATITIGRRPGLYYWKLETADDLLYVGRFFIPASE